MGKALSCPQNRADPPPFTTPPSGGGRCLVNMKLYFFFCACFFEFSVLIFHNFAVIWTTIPVNRNFEWLLHGLTVLKRCRGRQ